MHQRERDLERLLVRTVEQVGGLAYKFTSPGRRAVPDRIVVFGGRTYFVEMKAPGARPTAAQHREHDRLRRLGADVSVIDSEPGIAAFVTRLLGSEVAA